MWELKQPTISPFDQPVKAVFEDPDNWYRAEVCWDGCIEFYRAFNSPLSSEKEYPEQLIDNIHICQIDDMIERLQALKKAAIEFFGEDWR